MNRFIALHRVINTHLMRSHFFFIYVQVVVLLKKDIPMARFVTLISLLFEIVHNTTGPN